MSYESALDLLFRLFTYGMQYVAELAVEEEVPDSVFRAKHFAQMTELDKSLAQMLGRLRKKVEPEVLP